MTKSYKKIDDNTKDVQNFSPNLSEQFRMIRLFFKQNKSFNNLSKFRLKIARGINQASALTNQHLPECDCVVPISQSDAELRPVWPIRGQLTLTEMFPHSCLGVSSSSHHKIVAQFSTYGPLNSKI